jgi:hypothetical protein
MKGMTLANRRGEWRRPTLAPYPRRPFTFHTSTGIESARIVDDNWIVGVWQSYSNSLRIDPKADVLAEFANWPNSPKDVLRFTAKWGPLDVPFRGDEEFRFQVSEWQQVQVEFRGLWEEKMPQKGKPVSLLPHSEMKVQEGEEFEFVFSNLSYRTSTLRRLLILELLARPRERMRKCLKLDCPNPYFFATRLQQRYCSEPCAQWAQLGWKRAWWDKEGSKRRTRSTKKAKNAPRRRKD